MKLSPNQKRAIRHLWKGELTMAEIAEEMQFTAEELAAAAATLNLPERVDPDVYLPTSAEIRWAAAQIREGWSQAEREARLCAAWSGKINATGGDTTNAGRGATCAGAEGGQADGSSR